MSLLSRCVKQFQTKCSFSIDHILNVAGEKCKSGATGDAVADNDEDEERKFEWLTCTRYKPPKLQRQRKRDGVQRRKPGTNPRIPFSSSQVAFLEAKFVRTPYLSSADVSQLAASLQLSETRVKIWFQNRRARERRDRESKAKALLEPTTSQRPGSSSSDGCVRLHENCVADTRPTTVQQSSRSVGVTCHQPLGLYHGSAYVFTPLDLSDRKLLCK